MKTTTVTGQTYVKTLRHYLDANASRFSTTAKGNNNKLPAALYQKRDSAHPSPSLSFFPYMSLLAVTGTAVATPPLDRTPYMPSDNHLLSLDLHHLYFLYVHFDYLGLTIDTSTLGDIPPDGFILQDDTYNDDGDDADSDRAPSIRSVSSTMSTLSLGSGWQFWKKRSFKEEEGLQSAQEHLSHIYQYLAKIQALKLHMHVMIDPATGIPTSGARVIRGYEIPLFNAPSPCLRLLSLSPFQSLSCLELDRVHPRWIADWPTLGMKLTHLVIRDAGIDHINQVSSFSFPGLQRLSLPKNHLTDIGSLDSMKFLTHLNLTNNLLIEVPSALSCLCSLSSLDLSHNMITSTLGIHIVIGNLHALNLRGNRLIALVGVERLWALKRLDVAENQLADRMDISRLIDLPDLEDLWVADNPFTVSSETYRVDLFIDFMAHNPALKLDGTGPTMTEKAQCHSSVSNQYRYQSTPVAITKAATVVNIPAMAEKNDFSSSPITTRSMPELPQMVRSKSKKTKRVIRLRQDLIPSSMESAPDEDEHVLRYAELQQAIERPELLRRKSSASKKSSSSTTTANGRRRKSAPSTMAHHFRSSSPPPPLPSEGDEAFRRKIELMRQEAGTGWLRVLQEMETNKDGVSLL